MSLKSWYLSFKGEQDWPCGGRIGCGRKGHGQVSARLVELEVPVWHPSGGAMRGQTPMREVRGDVNCGCRWFRGSSAGRSIDWMEKETFSASPRFSVLLFLLLSQSWPPCSFTILRFFWCRCHSFLNHLDECQWYNALSLPAEKRC